MYIPFAEESTRVKYLDTAARLAVSGTQVQRHGTWGHTTVCTVQYMHPPDSTTRLGMVWLLTNPGEAYAFAWHNFGGWSRFGVSVCLSVCRSSYVEYCISPSIRWLCYGEWSRLPPLLVRRTAMVMVTLAQTAWSLVLAGLDWTGQSLASLCTVNCT